MSISFGWNTNNGISMNPSITIRSIMPQITSLEIVSGVGMNSSDIIHIGRFSLFYRDISDFYDRSVPWHGAAKSKSENLGGNSIFENTEHENSLEVEKLGARIL